MRVIKKQVFLNKVSINESLNNEKKTMFLMFIFIIIYLIFMFLITKPYFIDNCKNPIILLNSTCHHKFWCNSDNKCGYIDSCSMLDCNSVVSWLYYLFVINLLFSVVMIYFSYNVFYNKENILKIDKI